VSAARSAGNSPYRPRFRSSMFAAERTTLHYALALVA
jgi:hypothetical protein